MNKASDILDLDKLLQVLAVSDQEFVRDVVNKTIQEKYSNNSIETIWYDENNATSFWILLVNGINNHQEVSVIKQMLYWKEFFARSFAKVRCVQSYEQFEFSLILKKFKINACPTIIVSDTISFENNYIVKPDTLLKLSEKTEGVVELCNQIHQELLIGSDREIIEALIKSKQILKSINHKEEYKRVLSQGDLEGFFNLSFASSDFKEDKNIYNLLHIVSGEYKSLSKDELIGILHPEEIGRRRNAILWKLNKLLDDLTIN